MMIEATKWNLSAIDRFNAVQKFPNLLFRTFGVVTDFLTDSDLGGEPDNGHPDVPRLQAL